MQLILGRGWCSLFLLSDKYPVFRPSVKMVIKDLICHSIMSTTDVRPKCYSKNRCACYLGCLNLISTFCLFTIWLSLLSISYGRSFKWATCSESYGLTISRDNAAFATTHARRLRSCRNQHQAITFRAR